MDPIGYGADDVYYEHINIKILDGNGTTMWFSYLKGSLLLLMLKTLRATVTTLQNLP